MAGNVRDRLRLDAEKHYELIFDSLRSALEAGTSRWGTCSRCQKKVEVEFPDIRARTQALQVLIDQGYGKPVERQERKVVSATVADLESLSNEELEAIVAGFTGD
jgi:hypothetical protein